jgi:hypothetical protein
MAVKENTSTWYWGLRRRDWPIWCIEEEGGRGERNCPPPFPQPSQTASDDMESYGNMGPPWTSILLPSAIYARQSGADFYCWLSSKSKTKNDAELKRYQKRTQVDARRNGTTKRLKWYSEAAAAVRLFQRDLIRINPKFAWSAMSKYEN